MFITESFFFIKVILIMFRVASLIKIIFHLIVLVQKMASTLS